MELSTKVDNRASAKLWADALEEEQELARRSASTSRLAQYQQKQQEYSNWTGDESVQDAVLRMLVDKYKPLRTGLGIKTAEEKMKDGNVLGVGTVNAAEVDDIKDLTAALMASRSSNTTQASLESTQPSVPPSEHRPWHTTFRAPSHVANVRQMRLPPPARPTISGNRTVAQILPDDTRARNLERDKKKKAAQAGRLTNAVDSSLDYRLGKRGQEAKQVLRPNPVTAKGWASLVEEKIERARNEGHFNTLKGRGKPFVQNSESSNPFIAREEFLMNRIIQRQGAAPPWVEYQGELETAISTFRATLRSTWKRRAVRTLVTSNPQEFLSRLKLEDIPERDLEWEKREEGYHKEAVEDVNRLVRKYNGAAPYAVRRTYMSLDAELEKAYKECSQEILEEVKARGEKGQYKDTMSGGAAWDDEEWGGGGGGGGSDGPAGGLPDPKKRFRLLEWWERMVGRWVV
ncbi:hypothetical protein M422DRAFT_198592 [Sphaerobolus stellatus SS14]|nr:hypothetical protein M422DRAFT_198592 [Sphaerobolus stellatus SS14]